MAFRIWFGNHVTGKSSAHTLTVHPTDEMLSFIERLSHSNVWPYFLGVIPLQLIVNIPATMHLIIGTEAWGKGRGL
jgi:hypothetical protein